MTIDLLDDDDDDDDDDLAIEMSAAFSADDVRRTTIEDHCEFLRGLRQVDRKAANYLKVLSISQRWLHRSSFVAAEGQNLHCSRDQWCSDPDDVQIVAVWFHIVPMASVGRQRYHILPPWQPWYELDTIQGPTRRRYSEPWVTQ